MYILTKNAILGPKVARGTADDILGLADLEEEAGLVVVGPEVARGVCLAGRDALVLVGHGQDPVPTVGTLAQLSARDVPKSFFADYNRSCMTA